jgi:site-specific recombinase XerD
LQVRTDKLTNDEVLKYFQTLDGLNNQMYNCLVNVLYTTGMRIGEAHSMRTRDINWKTNEIHIYMTKLDGTRDVLLDDDTATMLKYYISYNKSSIEKREREFDKLVKREKKRLDDTVNEELKDGKVVRTRAEVIRRELRAYIRKLKSPIFGVTYRQLDRIVHEVGKKAGITKSVHPHTWRYHFAQTLHDCDGDIVEIQGLMGHRSIATTRGYLLQNKKRERELHNRAFGRKQ